MKDKDKFRNIRTGLIVMVVGGVVSWLLIYWICLAIF
jgi:hypothetical protein